MMETAEPIRTTEKSCVLTPNVRGYLFCVISKGERDNRHIRLKIEDAQVAKRTYELAMDLLRHGANMEEIRTTIMEEILRTTVKSSLIPPAPADDAEENFAMTLDIKL